MTVVAAVMLFAGCGGGDYTPKPTAFLRIDVPEHQYALADTAQLPFLFELDEEAELTIKKETAREVWVDLNYPRWDGVVFLSYKHLLSADDLRGQTDTSSRLLESHYQFTSGIEEQQYTNPDERVYATTYHLKGNNVASTYQFWATDSTHHFLRGALYLNHAPNNDSLAPVLEYLQEDMDHLIETLRWR